MKKPTIVEEALIQMGNLESVIAENAKGVLAATMREEIGQMVKESLLEADDDLDIELDDMGSDDDFEMDDISVDMDSDDDEFEMGASIGDSDDDDMEMDDFEMDDMEMDDFDDDAVVDLTMATDDEIITVFKAMGDEDGVIVSKDGDTIDLNDTDAGEHYKISLGESSRGQEGGEKDYSEFYRAFNAWKKSGGMARAEAELAGRSRDEDEFDERNDYDEDDELEMDIDDIEGEYSSDDEDEDLVFEIEMDDDEEIINISKSEAKEGFKPKGMGMGKPKFDYKINSAKGFKEDMKMGTKGVGMGKPKFEFKEEDDEDMDSNDGETTEASRTLGNGKSFGRNGLPKRRVAPQNLRMEEVQNELNVLRERNEEYRKALNIFKNKLNEVAIFNSNLAYATRLFTEQTTTKAEKINILRRFDTAESLKESKTLYKLIKEELSSQGATPTKVSLKEQMEKTPASGSAANLIESKTYENPQFMRIKDLMAKM